MATHMGRIDAPVLIGVGAAFDFLAGTKRQAPAWMQRNGLEWLFRLCVEPRRLWRRYAYIVPGFLMLAAAELVRSALCLPRLQFRNDFVGSSRRRFLARRCGEADYPKGSVGIASYARIGVPLQRADEQRAARQRRVS